MSKNVIFRKRTMRRLDYCSSDYMSKFFSLESHAAYMCPAISLVFAVKDKLMYDEVNSTFNHFLTIMSSLHTFLIVLSLGYISSFPFPEECGINYIQPDNVGNATHKIVGGFEAVPGSWPWQAYLKFKGRLIH